TNKKFLAVRESCNEELCSEDQDGAPVNNQVCNANFTATEGGGYNRSDILALPKFAINRCTRKYIG
ncbi:hypothetical protein, partial [Treponema vincentii]|uniref:hypothetical protein n=1 Tax=Treponema vincentii TaxID=69710 RepID=UPI000586DBB1